MTPVPGDKGATNATPRSTAEDRVNTSASPGVLPLRGSVGHPIRRASDHPGGSDPSPPAWMGAERRGVGALPASPDDGHDVAGHGELGGSWVPFALAVASAPLWIGWLLAWLSHRERDTVIALAVGILAFCGTWLPLGVTVWYRSYLAGLCCVALAGAAWLHQAHVIEKRRQSRKRLRVVSR